jgi:hypothetical protein
MPAVTLALLAIGCAPSLEAHRSTAEHQATAPAKAGRTPAQQKIDSQLLFEIDRQKGVTSGGQVQPGRGGVRIDHRNRALVEVRADVTTALQARMRKLQGTVVSTAPAYRAIVAWMPLSAIERLAADPRITAIRPLAEPALRR